MPRNRSSLTFEEILRQRRDSQVRQADNWVSRLMRSGSRQTTATEAMQRSVDAEFVAAQRAATEAREAAERHNRLQRILAEQEAERAREEALRASEEAVREATISVRRNTDESVWGFVDADLDRNTSEPEPEPDDEDSEGTVTATNRWADLWARVHTQRSREFAGNEIAQGVTLNTTGNLSAARDVPPRPRPASVGGTSRFGSFGISDPFSDSIQERQPTEAEIQDPEGNLMRNTIGHLLGISNQLGAGATHPLIVGNELVGIEIELENAPVLNMTYWNSIPDGSLRNNGQEYVMKQPLGGEALRQAIMEVDTRLAAASVDPSWRCSTHGHFNFLNDTVASLKRFLLGYTAYEFIIYDCSQTDEADANGIFKTRWNNNFCPAYGFAQSQLITLAKIWHLDGIQFLNALRDSGVKYSGLNVLPLFSQGSLEFRGSEPKYSKGQLFRFVNRLLSLKKLAKEWTGTESEMVDFLRTANVSSVLQRSLPRFFRVDESRLQQCVLNAFDIINLGEYKRPNDDTEVVPGNRSYWRQYFGMDMPETVTLGRLAELCRAYRRENFQGERWIDDNGNEQREEGPRHACMSYFVTRSSVPAAREYAQHRGDIRWS